MGTDHRDAGTTAPPRGFHGNRLVWGVWVMVPLALLWVVLPAATWAPHASTSSSPVAAWGVFALALACIAAGAVIAFRPLSRARASATRLGWSLAALTCLGAGVALGLVPDHLVGTL